MSITVERRYRVTTNGAESDLSEDEARALAFGLLTALGIAPAATEPATIPAQWAPAEVVPPPQLPSGQVATPTPETEAPHPTPFTDDRGLKMGSWEADLPELRRLMGEGVPLKEIAASLNRPLPATSAQYYKVKREAKADAAQRAPAPLPTIAGMFAAKEAAASVRLDGETQSLPPSDAAQRVAAPAVGHVADDEWTDAQSRYLVDLMTRPSASMQYAATCCGHSFMQTSKRWTALKAAGIVSVARWDAQHGRAQA